MARRFTLLAAALTWVGARQTLQGRANYNEAEQPTYCGYPNAIK